MSHRYAKLYMNGIVIYDKKDAEHNAWFIEHIINTGRENGLEITLILTEDIITSGDSSCLTLAYEQRNGDDNLLINNECISNCDFAIVRNRNYKLSELLENKGIRCFNSSYVCKIGNDKWEMYKDFSQAGIPVMYTQLSKLPYPFVFKPRDGHGGENVYLINNKGEFESTILNISEYVRTKYADVVDHICSESVQDYIKNKYIYQMPATEKGRDIRVYVVGNTILTAMERKSCGDEFRANFSLGGEADEYALTDEELKLAAKVAKHINADFVGIDIIYNNGKPVVNEIEDAVGTRMLYSKTDIDPVREFILWIKQNIQ